MKFFTKNDFKVGQKAYLLLQGNASRWITNKEDLIEECTVKSIGRKYISAERKNKMNIKFEENDFCSYGSGLIEKTDYCIDYMLYPTKQDILDDFEKEDIIKDLRPFFDYGSGYNKLSLEDLKKIQEIVNRTEEESE